MKKLRNFWKKNKRQMKDKTAVSAVIGVILMVAITVAISASVFMYANGMTQTASVVTPSLSFQKGSDWLMIIKGDIEIDWSELSFKNTDNTTTIKIPTGAISAGDTITDITGTLTISYQNQMLGRWSF